MFKGRRPSEPVYVHFGGLNMDERSEETHEGKGAWLAENDLRPTFTPLKFIELPFHSSGSGMINFGRSANLSLQAVIF